jgi:hypothetical protein
MRWRTLRAYQFVQFVGRLPLSTQQRSLIVPMRHDKIMDKPARACRPMIADHPSKQPMLQARPGTTHQQDHWQRRIQCEPAPQDNRQF